MHAGQHAVTAAQARALIADQMPDLAGLPLRRVGAAGTDSVLYRLGPALVARFPRLPHAEAQLAVVARWLPRVAPEPGPAVPLELRQGGPGGGYPFHWSVAQWLPGRVAAPGPAQQRQMALDLAGFLAALQARPTPPEAPRNPGADRLELRLAALEVPIAEMQAAGEGGDLTELLQAARALPPAQGAPVWLHGDLHALNLLMRRGRLSGVIDWGTMRVGDPAIDLMVAWALFDAPARAVLRAALPAPAAAWARARALAFAKAVRAIPYYRQSNPEFCAAMRVMLARVLQDGPLLREAD